MTPGAPGGGCCTAEEVFEYVDGSLEPGREREVRAHLRRCGRCEELRERERSLSAALRSPGLREMGWLEERGGGASHRVAMALPTRSPYAKAMWGGGAALILVAALVSLSLHSVQPFSSLTRFMSLCWGLTSGLSDAAGVILAVSGWTILAALAIGALVDVLIAATVIAAARWWRLRGA